MSTYTQILYHITFSTKQRRATLDPEGRPEFLRYVWGVVENHQSHLYRINCVSDHVHLLASLHPSEALAGFIKDIKVASSLWIKKANVFPAFSAWQEGYGAFTCSYKDRHSVVEYIKGQDEHHKAVSFNEEFRNLLAEMGLKFDERFLE